MHSIVPLFYGSPKLSFLDSAGEKLGKTVATEQLGGNWMGIKSTDSGEGRVEVGARLLTL